ncbi:FAD-binding monooxygenase [Streptomyces bambusae]|uniref:FAD-dependent oxidoreductase n=1 Tax=Streptomyces bambusae TaxID=1550616 RepID=UPI001CFD81D4|nr:FAD-binding monooxygenase [Streptomyces bambusae]MCB5165644.1 FAD-binding monooxygenase [Streptomyces bambusae]
MTGQVGDRAIVLGGSMAGLIAARVLADAYGEVLIVERDALTGRDARRGVPQGQHVHGLLARGQQILEELFPGFTQGAIDSGIPTGDLGELRWYFNGKRLKPATTGCICVSAARPVLENHVRTYVLDTPGIKVLDRHSIDRLVTDGGGTRVTGVDVTPLDGGAASYPLTADLVVDTTGRGSRTPVWLEELGYRRPAEDRIKIDLSYTTRKFRLPDESILNGDLSINPVSGPAHPRGAFFSRIEDGLCAVSLTGVLGDSAPADLEGFLAWTRTLPVTDVYDVLKDAEPVDDGATFRYPASVRRRYERLDRFPAGYLVLGDAVCSFNPVYGQGMTVAAQEAMVLRDHLSRGPVDALRFFKDINSVIDVAWDFSAGGDLGFPEVEGERNAKVKIGGAFMAKLQAAATVDGFVTGTFMRVAGFVEPPQALMSPKMVYRVLRGARQAAAQNSTTTKSAA